MGPEAWDKTALEAQKMAAETEAVKKDRLKKTKSKTLRQDECGVVPEECGEAGGEVPSQDGGRD